MDSKEFDVEQELADGFKIRQVEERLEMGCFCCDPRFDPEGNFEGSCGCEG